MRERIKVRKGVSITLAAVLIGTVLVGLFGSIVVFIGETSGAGGTFGGGNGSVGNPYVITDVDDLQNMSSNLSAHYVLANDIDASATVGWNSGAGFVPVGNSSNPFNGFLDGRNHTITGLFIKRPSEDYVGLFGYLEMGSQVLNLRLKDANITGNDYVGAIAGFSQGWLSECSADGNVGGAQHVGGIVGCEYHTSSYSVRTESADKDYVDFGAMNGFTFGTSWSIVEKVMVPRNATKFGWHFFRGSAWRDKEGDIAIQIRFGRGPSVYVWLMKGGWRSLAMDPGERGVTVEKGRWYRICLQYDSSSDQYQLYVNGLLMDTISSLGGMNDSTNTNPFYFGGQYRSSGSIYTEADIVIAHQAWYQRALSTSEIDEYRGFGTGDFFSTQIGANGITDASGNGHNGVNGATPIYLANGVSGITNATNYGNVSGANYVGGIAGMKYGTIKNTYSLGSVFGNSYVGGLVGENSGGTINDCYSAGLVNGTGTDVGGFAGCNLGTITDCFWDNQTTGQTTDTGNNGNIGGVTGLSTAEMMKRATFDPPWDFVKTWGIYEDNTYPFLRALGPIYVPRADIELSLESSPETIMQIDDYLLIYVNITNNGPDNAANINVTLTGSGNEMSLNSINQTVTMRDSGLSWYPSTLRTGRTAWMLINISVSTSGSFLLNGTSVSDTPDLVPNNNNASIFITINAPPVATDDPNHIIDEDSGPLEMDVLINDIDPDGDDITVINVTQGVHGTVTITDGGKDVTYAPDADWNGQDHFNYTVSDGRDGTDTATVNITVLPNDDASVAMNDTFEIAEDSGTTTLDVLANDYDVDGDNVSVSGIREHPAHGTAVIALDGLGINYTPAENFTGTDTFNYSITGGGRGATVIINITPVEDAPLAHDDSVAIDEDSSVIIEVLSNDIDADGDALTITDVIRPENGTITIIDNGRNLSYTPYADWYGRDHFNYTISDGTLRACGSVFITVNPVNDPPEIHTISLPDGTVGEAYKYKLNITDVDDDVNAPAFTVTLRTNATGPYFYVDSNLSIVGRPDTAGTFWVLVTAWDRYNSTSVNYTLTINPAGGTTPGDSDGEGVSDAEDETPQGGEKSAKGGDGNDLLYVLIMLVLVGALAGYVLMRRKGKGEAATAAGDADHSEEYE